MREGKVFRAVLLRVEPEEVRGEKGNVFAAGAERRKLEANDVQAIEEVFAEAAFAHGFMQINVGCGDDANVNLDLLHAAEVHEASVLQDAQNLGLHIHAHGADLVEKERAAIGHFEEALLRRDGRGEGSFDVTEERRFEQLRRHGAGVDGNEWPIATGRVGVNRLRDQLLAGTALALDQDCGTAGRNLRNKVEEAKHRLALADDIFKVVTLLQGALELDDLFFGTVAVDCGANVGEQLLVVPAKLPGRSFPAPCTDGIDYIADTVQQAVIMMIGRFGCISIMRGRRSIPL